MNAVVSSFYEIIELIVCYFESSMTWVLCYLKNCFLRIAWNQFYSNFDRLAEWIFSKFEEFSEMNYLQILGIVWN